MGIQYEQSGHEISFLQIQLIATTTSWGPISTKTPTYIPTKTSPSSIGKWLDPWAPNAKRMLTSVKLAQHHRTNSTALDKNLSSIVLSLLNKEYPRVWWKNSFISACDKWGLKSQAILYSTNPSPAGSFIIPTPTHPRPQPEPPPVLLIHTKPNLKSKRNPKSNTNPNPKPIKTSYRTG